MEKYSSFAAYTKAENSSFKKRLAYALKAKSLKGICSVVADVAAVHFARYLVLDCFGTKRFCWTLKAAYAWFPYCSAQAKIIDTLDFSTIAERTQKYA